MLVQRVDQFGCTQAVFYPDPLTAELLGNLDDTVNGQRHFDQ